MSGLRGKRVVVTRPRGQAVEMADLLRARGAIPILFPTIRISPPPDPDPLDRALEAEDRYDWIVLTSVNGVEAVAERLATRGLAWPRSSRVAAIGPATARAIESLGARVDFVPPEFRAERIAEGMGDVTGRRVLLARADIAREHLRLDLEQRGALVDEITAYATEPADADHDTLAGVKGGADVITFTSSSTVRGFLTLLGDDAPSLLSSGVTACIGPITASALQAEGGISPSVVADTYTIPGLLSALEDYYKDL